MKDRHLERDAENAITVIGTLMSRISELEDNLENVVYERDKLAEELEELKNS